MPEIDSATVLAVNALRGGPFGSVSLALHAGECVAVAGPSGAGKSLLLRAIADLDPTVGDVILDGTPRERMRPSRWRSQVGYLPAEPMWWSDVVGDHLPAEADALLPALGFDIGVRTWAVERLSSGERQRLALARMLANRPRVLLLDEPTANLDPDNTQRVEAIVRDYCAGTGAAVLWVSHDPAQRERVARRVVDIVQGTIGQTTQKDNA